MKRTLVVLLSFFVLQWHITSVHADEEDQVKSTGFLLKKDRSDHIHSAISKNLYFTIRPDYRKCVSPICGGWFVNPVNRKRMRCPNGRFQKECYVGTDKIDIRNLSEEQLQTLRQAMYDSRVLINAAISNSVEYGELQISDAWISANNEPPSGRFFSVSKSGIVCITYPCLTMDAQVLNRRHVKAIADLDLSMVRASEAQLVEANTALSSDEGLPISGSFYKVSGPAGEALGISASQFYLKVVGEKPLSCMPTGCSGQICSDTDVITTCEWRPEYACYRTATCAAQDNNACGWTMNDELKRCLASFELKQMLNIK